MFGNHLPSVSSEHVERLEGGAEVTGEGSPPLERGQRDAILQPGVLRPPIPLVRTWETLLVDAAFVSFRCQQQLILKEHSDQILC